MSEEGEVSEDETTGVVYPLSDNEFEEFEEFEEFIPRVTKPIKGVTYVPPPQEGRPVFTQELYYDNILDTVTDADREAIIGRFKRAARKRKAGF
jgi:hypothetical protein